MTSRSRSQWLALCWLLAVPPALLGQSAPGGPGERPTWTPASKDGIGTSFTTESKVWFTLQGGILTEVYYPRVDMADVHGLEFAVSDGKQVWIESRDMRHAIERIEPQALLFRQTSSDPAGRFTITKTYATDPERNTLLIDSRVRSINYNVDCVAGTIYLMGVAQNQAELQRVIDHARDIPYVRGVVSFVRLKNDPARQQPVPVQPAAATP